MTDPDIVNRLQADAIFFGTRQEPLLVDHSVCREMAECWESAADEIERLRKKLLAEENAYDILRLENEHLQTDRNNLALSLKELEDKCKRLEIELGRYKRMYCRAVCKDVYALAAWSCREIDRITAERDEARRIACKMEERAGCDESGCPKNGTAQDHATRRGWDCFKENTNEQL